MIRYGTISEIDSDNCKVRVDFEEDAVVSNWMPFLVPKTKEDSFFVIPDVGEYVVCLVDTHADTGVVLGSIYTKKTSPKISGHDKTAVKFKDGTEVEYDRQNHKMRLKIAGKLSIETDDDISVKSSGNVNVEGLNVTVKASVKVTIDAPNMEATGNMNVSGTITANGDVKAGGGIITLLTHKHPTPIGPTGPPIP